MPMNEHEIVERASVLAETGMCMSHAAQELGLAFNTLKRISRRHKLAFVDGRSPTSEQIQLASEAHEAGKFTSECPADALNLGKAGEHLVCADLLARGYNAFLSDQGLPYDLLVDLGGRLLRVQVKTTFAPRNTNFKGKSPNLVYGFHVRRRGKNGRGRLDERHCDIIALVGWQHKAIAYFRVEDVAQTVALYPPGYQFFGKFVRKRMSAIDGFPPEAVLL